MRGFESRRRFGGLFMSLLSAVLLTAGLSSAAAGSASTC